MKKPIKIPITNAFDGSDYSAQILVGSKQTPANVILDTGSSTLAVSPSVYSGIEDTHLKATRHAQLVEYGTGGWAGPLVTTSLTMGVRGNKVFLRRVPVAIADVQQRGNFTGVDGILGLAYNRLNGAYDFTSLLTNRGINPAVTYPWPFPSRNFGAWARRLGKVLSRMPKVYVTPYFDALEKNGTIANKFAFYTLRSLVSRRSSRASAVARDPLNKGFFILGGGEEQKDLYRGEFVAVRVLHDLFYNTNLKAVQVEGCAAGPALPLQAKYKADQISNCIVDSGTSDLTLAADVYSGVMMALEKLNPRFIALIARSKSNQTVPVSKLHLNSWPNINFILTGEKGEDVKLTCTPQTYWQVDFPAAGNAVFQISGPLDAANQSILGLPLMNNYFTVFDRSLDAKGVIRFAPIRRRSPA
jgi:hypothetical protein